MSRFVNCVRYAPDGEVFVAADAGGKVFKIHQIVKIYQAFLILCIRRSSTMEKLVIWFVSSALPLTKEAFMQ